MAVLAAGIAVAIIRPGDLGKEDGQIAEPTPTPSRIETTAEPSPEPSPEPTEEPTAEPTEEPSPEPTQGGNGGGGKNGNGGEEGPVLAETGGPVLPFLFGGTILMAAGVGLWRLRRRPL